MTDYNRQAGSRIVLALASHKIEPGLASTRWTPGANLASVAIAVQR